MSDSAKILTIDDETMLRQGIVAFLEDYEYEVVEGENGRHGIEVFEQEKPDLVLTDLQMPEMTGLEVLEYVKENSPETPIIVVSGAGDMDDVIEALRLGAWDYITKPITDLEVLHHAVNKSLERFRLLQENRAYAAEIQRSYDLLQEDQEAGRSVQQRLLPAEPLLTSNFECDSSVTPSLYLSGDFVDYFEVDDETMVVYLADVSGHGASSAFITVLLKSLISQSLTNYQTGLDSNIISPDQMMAYLSNEIYSAKLGKYMTMVYCVIDKVSRKMKYGVGGHYPNPVLMTKDKQAEYLQGDGYPVGIIPKATYKCFEHEFNEGDKLILFSDGVMEIFMNDQDMSAQDAGLLEFIKKHNANITKVLEELGVTETSEQPDDISILVCKNI